MIESTETASAAELIDVAHYSDVAGEKFNGICEAYAHYLRQGQVAGLNPSPYFYTRWYAWQNPDCCNHPSPLDHFFEKAATRVIDPAPFIDSVAILRERPDATSALGIYRMLLSGSLPNISPKIDEHFASIAVARKRFRDRIDLHVLRDTGGSRKNVVWVQSGREFQLARWFKPDKSRSWDLLCNWYDLSRLDLRFGETVLRQSGTKITGIANVLRRLPEILGRYDRVLFVDDDLVFQHEDLDQIFDLAVEHDLDLFQPALLPGSHCVWHDLFQRAGGQPRRLTEVEIMMFGFSHRALALCAPLFDESVSGFGTDFACSHAVRERGWQCGILDAVGVGHFSIIDEKGGSYYEFMRSLGVNQKLELYHSIARIGRNPEFRTLRQDEMNLQKIMN